MNVTLKTPETDGEIKGKAYVHWKSSIRIISESCRLKNARRSLLNGGKTSLSPKTAKA